MGLDWVLHKNKPKDGHEERFAEIDRLLREQELSAEKEQEAEKELETISVSAYEVIGCPRIGIDEAATVYFKTEIYPSSQELAQQNHGEKDEFFKYWMRPVEEVLKDETGKWVPHLAANKDGLAKMTGMIVSPMDFRGKVIGYCDFISSELQEEAYRDHTAEEAEDYGKRIELHVHGEMKKLNSRQKAQFEQERRYIEGAVEWLKFWGSRGFGFYAWY